MQTEILENWWVFKDDTGNWFYSAWPTTKRSPEVNETNV